MTENVVGMCVRVRICMRVYLHARLCACMHVACVRSSMCR